MRNSEFGFSLSEESVIEIKSLVEEYAQEILSVINDFQEELLMNITKANYDKLTRAIDGIIEIYNESVRRELKSRLFDIWENSGESLNFFAKQMGMGEESENIANELQETLEQIFEVTIDNRIKEIHIDNRTSAAKENFVAINDIFAGVVKKIQETSENVSREIDHRGEENEFYKLISPVMFAYSQGICNYFEAAQVSLDELEENYTTKMEAEKTQVDEAKKKVDLSELLNFSNLSYVGMSIAPVRIKQKKEIDLNRAEKEVIVEATNSSKRVGEEVKPNRFEKKVIECATEMAKRSNSESLSMFRELSSLINNTVYNEWGYSEKEVNPAKLLKVIEVYEEFYKEYGFLLKDDHSDREERSNYVKSQYWETLRSRNLQRFFANEKDKEVFYSHSEQLYQVYDSIARLMQNLVEEYMNESASYEQYTYGCHVLFGPIINGRLEKEDGKKYVLFSRRAAEKILNIYGVFLKADSEPAIQETESEEKKIEKKEHEKWAENDITEEQREKIVRIVEYIVMPLGIEEINAAVEKHYDVLFEGIQKKRGETTEAKKKEVLQKKSEYGRYLVTENSLRNMASACEKAENILGPLDQFYKEEFKKRDDGFERINTCIHQLSALFGKLGLGKIDLLKSTEMEVIDNLIGPKISFVIGGLTPVKVVDYAAKGLSILDSVMPLIKKNRKLKNINKKAWVLTREDIQVPDRNRYIAQYMMEHYAIQYKLNGKWETKGCFPFYHNVVFQLKDEKQRRAFENAIFAAEEYIASPDNYQAPQNRSHIEELRTGLFLNLVRAGLESGAKISSDDANSLVDKLYYMYINHWHVTPRVSVNPDERQVKDR